MNKIEQAKIEALRHCRMGWGEWDANFVNALAAQMNVDKKTILSDRQRFMLDTLVYRYRRQLASIATFELPSAAPRETDYVRHPASQQSLFT